MYNPKYFTEDEFQKVSCSIADIDEVSLRLLDKARELAGVPFIITSAYRTREHNRRVGGATNSAHLRGRAFDIVAASSYYRYRIVSAALAVGFTRIGIGRTFVHIDNDSSLGQCCIWLYQ